MAKRITFEYEGAQYTLEYTRRSVKEMEAAGFVLEELSTKPVTLFPVLFAGAFKVHHKNLIKDQAKINTLYNLFDEKEELIAALADMYSDAMMSIFDEAEDVTKKVKWEKNF